VTRTLSISRQAGTLTKEREAKLLDMGFIFDGKQAQAVRDEYEAARLNGGKQAEAVRDNPAKPKVTGKRGRDGDKGGLSSADIAGQMQRTVAVGTRVEVLYTVNGEHKWFAGTVAAAGAPDERVVRARKQTDRFASCKMEGQTYVCADGAQNGADAAGDTHISNTCSAADDAAEAGTRSLWQVLFDDGDEDTITWPDPSGDVRIVPSREGGNAETDKDILKSGDRKKDRETVLWASKLERLRRFQMQHGHVQVKGTSRANQDLRRWIRVRQTLIVKSALYSNFVG